MTPTITITEDRITAALAGISAALADPLPLMQDFGDYLVDSTTQRFLTGTAPDGSVWAPKSPVTIAAQGGRKTNRLDTRPLFGPSKALSSTINYEAFSDRVEWGSPMIYAAMQHFGGSREAFPHLWGDIPARAFLGISPEDETNLLDIAGDWLMDAAGSSA